MRLFTNNETRCSLLLVICLLAYNYVDGPISFFVGCLFLFYCIARQGFKINKINQLVPMLLILAVGIIAGFNQMNSIQDFLRDIYYFTQPIIYIYVGYYLYKYYGKRYDLLYTMVIVAWILSIVYLVRVAQNPAVIFESTDITDIRTEIGKETVIQTVAVILITTQKIKVDRNRILLYAPIIIVFILQFSRAAFGTLAIYFLVYSFVNRQKFSSKTFFGIMAGLLVVLTAVMLLPSELLADLIARFAKSVTEVSSTTTVNWDLDTAYQHWRGYEIYIVLEEFKNGSFLQKCFGHGLGNRTELGHGITLLGMTSIPVFHNGYIQVLSKTGIVGVGALLFFYGKTFLSAAKYKACQNEDIANLAQCVMSYTLGILFYSYVKSGIFRGSSIVEYCILVGILVAQISEYRLQGREVGEIE